MNRKNAENFILGEVGKARIKLFRVMTADRCFFFGGIGAAAALLTELISLVVPFYYVHYAAAALFFGFLLFGVISSFLHKPTMLHAAAQLDKNGFKERIATAVECIEKKENTEYNRFEEHLIFDTERKMKENREKLLLNRRISGKLLALFIGILVLSVGAAFIPSKARETAEQQHAVRRDAKEKEKEVAEVIDALKELSQDPNLSDEEKKALQEAMQGLENSRQELKKVSSETGLKTANQNFSYKLNTAYQMVQAMEQTVQSAAVKEASEKLQGAANKQNGTSGQNQVAQGNQTGNNNQNGNNGNNQTGNNGQSGNNSNGQNGNNSQSGNNDNNQNGNSGQSGNNGNNQNGNNGQNGQNGNGGDGQNGNNGNGGADGSGGNGRGEGHVENTVNPNAREDEITAAGQGYLSGKDAGNGDIPVIKGQNGLDWEGERVPYSQVVGEYSESAYEGIEKGNYPEAMNDVIREYFGSLNND